jgi:hypothetical protein
MNSLGVTKEKRPQQQLRPKSMGGKRPKKGRLHVSKMRAKKPVPGRHSGLKGARARNGQGDASIND